MAGDRNIMDNFRSHPMTQEQTAIYTFLQNRFTDLAQFVQSKLPAGRYRELTQNSLEAAAMWANKALTHPSSVEVRVVDRLLTTDPCVDRSFGKCSGVVVRWALPPDGVGTVSLCHHHKLERESVGILNDFLRPDPDKPPEAKVEDIPKEDPVRPNPLTVVHEGGGFILKTDGYGRLYVALEEAPNENLVVSTRGRGLQGIRIGYGGSLFELVPSDHRAITFELNDTDESRRD